jgi:pyruvate kinase
LYRGCYPYHYERPPKAGTESNEPASESPRSPYMAMETWQEDVDTRFYWAIDLAKKEGMLKVGDTVVGIQGWKGGAGNSSVMRILTVPDVAPVQI